MRFQTGYYFRKGMVVQQDFEKGRSQRLWFRRYDRYKNLPFFQGLMLGAEGGGGGGGGLVRGTLRYDNSYQGSLQGWV